jgi:hypothetical protein
MKKNTFFVMGLLALLTVVLGFAACGKSYSQLQRQAAEAVASGDMAKAWEFQADMEKYAERAEFYDVLRKVILGIVIVAAIGLGIYWTYLKNNNPDKLPSFMKKLWGIKLADGVAKDTIPAVRAKPGVVIKKCLIVLLVIVCVLICNVLLTLLLDAMGIPYTVAPCVQIIVNACGVFALSKIKSLSSIKKPCAIAAGVISVLQLISRIF